VKIVRVRIGVFATVTGLVLLGAGVTTAQASQPPNHKVTLCHRTGAVAGGNTHAGYSIITVDIASVANAKDVRGHDGHPQVGNGPDGDIIPSYTYQTYTYPGKNLGNGGAAFLENGCKAATPLTPDSTSTTPSTTPSTPTSGTPTTTPAATTAATTATATAAPVSVLGTAAWTTPAQLSVLGTAAQAGDPLPSGAAAGQANNTGKLLAGGLTGLTALLAIGTGLVLRRRHGVV
jgi:hypothetical protein